MGLYYQNEGEKHEKVNILNRNIYKHNNVCTRKNYFWSRSRN